MYPTIWPMNCSSSASSMLGVVPVWIVSVVVMSLLLHADRSTGPVRARGGRVTRVLRSARSPRAVELDELVERGVVEIVGSDLTRHLDDHSELREVLAAVRARAEVRLQPLAVGRGECVVEVGG